MPANSLSNLLTFTAETAYLAGRLTLGYFQTGLVPQNKEDGSPVTLADRKAEELIRGRIEERFPSHAIVGEELGIKETEGASYRWFIDPIDGTKAFMRGVPLYSVLIGLEVEGKVRVGAVYFPALNEMLAAADGLGCWWNHRRAYVSPVTSLSEAVVTYTDVRKFSAYNRSEAWDRIVRATYFQAGWSDAYGYSLVATGRAEITLDPVMNVWDSGPFPPIFQEAGGYFGDWQGNSTIYNREAMATSQNLLPKLIRILQGDQT